MTNREAAAYFRKHIDAYCVTGICREAEEMAASALEKLDRKDILLRATYDILKKCDESYYVLNVMETTAIWDDVECDGYCLMEEIRDNLGLEDEK